MVNHTDQFSSVDARGYLDEFRQLITFKRSNTFRLVLFVKGGPPYGLECVTWIMTSPWQSILEVW